MRDVSIVSPALPTLNMNSASAGPESACSVVSWPVITGTAHGPQPGLLRQHSLAIWSLGHREIADNLDENGWKIAVFRPLPPAPSGFFFSYFLSYFFFFPFTPSSRPRNYFRSREQQARLAGFSSPGL